MTRKLFVSILLSVLVLTANPAYGKTASFTDVPSNHWAHDEIRFLTDKQVIKGFSNGKFQPTGLLTRKDAAVMLTRAMKLPSVSSPAIRPADLKPTMSGYNEMMIAANKGMLTLTGNRFNPSAPLTREEMAKALAVSYGYKGSSKTYFKDVSKGNPYYKYIDAIADNKITTGYADKTFKPKVTVNRAQFSTFLKRVYDRPLSYSVKKEGKLLSVFDNSAAAVNFAIKNQGSTVHPNNNSLMVYSQQPARLEKTGIQKGVIIYSGTEQSSFDTSFFKPYLKNGTTNMFDTFVISARLYPGGELQETSKNFANYKDWNWVSDKFFSNSGPLAQLEHSAKEAGRKVSVYIGIPYPKRNSAIVDLAGKKIPNTVSARKQLVNWYINNVEKKWQKTKPAHIELKGFYWINETVIHSDDEQLVSYTASVIHKKGKKFIYAPHSKSTNFDKWKEYGFDGAYLQPNTFRLQLGDPKARLHEAFLEAQIKGSGITLEIDTYSPHQIEAGVQNFKTYLEIADLYNLSDKSSLFYQGTEMVYRMSLWKPEAYQEAYSGITKFITK